MPQDVADGRALRLAEARGRLIEQNQPGLERKDHGEFERLLHAVRQEPRGEAMRSERPVSRRISTVEAGSAEARRCVPLGVSEVVRASRRHSATVRVSKMLAT